MINQSSAHQPSKTAPAGAHQKSVVEVDQSKKDDKKMSKKQAREQLKAAGSDLMTSVNASPESTSTIMLLTYLDRAIEILENCDKSFFITDDVHETIVKFNQDARQLKLKF